ncbi:MAG TPA: MFS transporter, partial [Streptosporangiaceae bacterium]|nr:MFS transporter [Streptosporangiaceae bacterium]
MTDHGTQHGAAQEGAAVPLPREAAPVAREAPPAGAGTGTATFASVWAVGEFRALWLAQLLSVAGDQLARVAITVLVYDRTRSALLSAVAFAVTFLPWVVGGLGLSGLADRRPRRRLMIACDLARMVLVGVMALASLASAATALWIMVALLFVVTLIDSPFKAARSALMPDILTGEKYVLGTAITQLTFQSGTVAGYALGGVVVAGLGPRAALLADAATFAASALLLRFGVRPRPAARPGSAAQPGLTGGRAAVAEMVAGIRLVFGDRTLRTLMLFGWLVAFYVVPMGLAAPYAAGFRGLPLPVGAGLVFAAVPFGTAVGAVVVGRLVPPDMRRRALGPMAVVACGVLTLCWTQPGLAASLGIFALAGVFAAYQVAANAAFVAAIPPGRRGQAFGLANGGMQVTQGLWFIAAGAAAEATSPAAVIAASGLVGAIGAVVLTA